jgi:hypothetical protein
MIRLLILFLGCTLMSASAFSQEDDITITKEPTCGVEEPQPVEGPRCGNDIDPGYYPAQPLPEPSTKQKLLVALGGNIIQPGTVSGQLFASCEVTRKENPTVYDRLLGLDLARVSCDFPDIATSEQSEGDVEISPLLESAAAASESSEIAPLPSPKGPFPMVLDPFEDEILKVLGGSREELGTFSGNIEATCTVTHREVPRYERIGVLKIEFVIDCEVSTPEVE